MNCLCRPSRIMSVRINLLDETDFIHEIKDDLPGQTLLDVVFARLNLIETSYFGIRYIDEENQTHWLDPASRISRQLKPKSDPYDLYFGVKFYAADPCKLLEEITRYQLFLQVKQDVLQGRLPVAFELAAELGAFVVQSELGDYDQRRHSKGYVSEFRLLPNQSNELETRVAELHQQLKGMSPATAELNYLDKVKWHDMYGVDLHPVLGEDSVEYFLGLTPSGIVVLRNKTTVAHYYWPRIAKVYYKGRYFMLRISDKNNELSTYGFETPRKSACKHLWRCCVEHHAFFRMVRVAPLPNSQSNNSDLFQLGSRLRYSSRAEKPKDALSNVGRAPPVFTRVPSKRQPRRVIDDFLKGSKRTPEGYALGNGHGNVNGNGLQTSVVVAPNMMPINNYESPYRSTYSIPTSLGIRPYHQQSQHGNASSVGGSACNSNLQTPDSPRSTRSAPWPRSQQRSLFGNNPSSPRSVRSAIATGGSGHHHHHHQHQHHQHQSSSHHRQSYASHRDHVSSSASAATAHQQRYRSSSVESHSSNDSRSTRRHKHRHRRTSDNESELSRGSGRSGRSHHRKHRRSRHRRDSAGSDHDSTRGRSYSGHRTSSVRSGSAELIDSTSQWREVQRRQAEASLGQSSVQQASVSKSSMVARSLHSNDSHSDTHSHHKSRRHRKNKSPSDSRNRIWSSELAKHLQFDLVDTTGMTEDQLREIPYTVVETNSKRSTMNMKIHKSGSKSSVGGKSTGSGNTITNGSNSTNGQGKNRVDRIRGLYFQNSNANDNASGRNGSIRSASTISSRECERNNGLVRMMSSMSMGDFISPTGSNLSPLENSALRVSHEHTDSGLGADQDYAYSSERSSDSTRYGTNKSSGASSGSHRKSGGIGGGNNAYNSLMQQTVSNQQQQHQQQQQQLHPKQQQPQRQNSFYAQRQPNQNYNHSQTNQNTNHHPSKALAPIHNNTSHSHGAAGTTNPTNHSVSSSSFGGNGNEKCANTNSSSNNNGIHSGNGNSSNIGVGNRLLNYTTFENNQYKFSLNNVFGKASNGAAVNGSGNNGSSSSAGFSGGGSACISSNSGNSNTNKRLDSFVEWPNTPAAPYYYNGPSSVAALHAKKRDAKSDIGVPTRRLSGQAITKTQLLTGQLATASCYPMPTPIHTSGMAFDSRLHPAKSDLFLSYIHSSASGEYERPYIYNYKMPQMPDFLRPTTASAQQQQAQHQQQPPDGQQMSAYHISGAQTADPPPLYKPSSNSATAGSMDGGMLFGGAAPATDVLYYQFDNGKPPIVQQPKSLLHKTANNTTTVAAANNGCGSGAVVGPLVFLQHGANMAPTNVTTAPATTQQTCTTTTTTNNHITNYINMNTTNNHSNTPHSSTCSDGSIEEEHDKDVYEEEQNQQMEANSAKDEDNLMANELNASAVTSPGCNSSSSGNNNNNYYSNRQSNASLDGIIVTTSTMASTSILANNNLDNCNANVYASKSQQVSTPNNHPIPCPNNPAPTSSPLPPVSPVSLPQPAITMQPSNCNTTLATATTSNSLNANTSLNRNQTMNQTMNQNQNQIQNPNQNQNPKPNQNQNQVQLQNLLQQQQNQNFNLSLNQNLNSIQQQSTNPNATQMRNHLPNSNVTVNVNASTTQNQIQNQTQNPAISSSLEIILSPIIQSSRRAQ